MIINITYADRLNKTELISLEQRRVRGDLIHMFKMSKNTELFKSMFKLRDSTSLKGSNLNLKHDVDLMLENIFLIREDKYME